MPRTANGFVGDAQAASSGGTDVERSRELGVAWSGGGRRPCDRKAVEVNVLAYIVNRDIEAGRVGQVEDIEGELQRGALGDLHRLDQRDIRAPLPGLAENIAFAVLDEIGLVRIVRRNCAVQGAWIQQRNAETAALSAGTDPAPDAPVSACCGRTAIERNDWIRDAIVVAIENAADCARVIDHAVGLTTLDDGQTGKRPSIGNSAFESKIARKTSAVGTCR